MINFYQTLKDRIQGKAPKGAKRASGWGKIRRAHMQRESTCQVCGRGKKLEVHHVIPFHVFPDLELNSENLVTLCKRCHLFIGHLGDYRCVNTTCLSDIAHWGYRFTNRRGVPNEWKKK